MTITRHYPLIYPTSTVDCEVSCSLIQQFNICSLEVAWTAAWVAAEKGSGIHVSGIPNGIQFAKARLRTRLLTSNRYICSCSAKICRWFLRQQDVNPPRHYVATFDGWRSNLCVVARRCEGDLKGSSRIYFLWFRRGQKGQRAQPDFSTDAASMIHVMRARPTALAKRLLPAFGRQGHGVDTWHGDKDRDG